MDRGVSRTLDRSLCMNWEGTWEKNKHRSLSSGERLVYLVGGLEGGRLDQRQGDLGKKHTDVPTEAGNRYVDLFISCQCPLRPPMAEEVLNWVDKMMNHPVAISQPLSLATFGIVPWAHELSSGVGRDKGYAWAQRLGTLWFRLTYLLTLLNAQNASKVTNTASCDMTPSSPNICLSLGGNSITSALFHPWGVSSHPYEWTFIPDSS